MRILMASILNIDKDMNGVTVCIKELRHSLKKRDNQVKLVSPYTCNSNSLLFKILGRFSYWYQNYNYPFLTLAILLIKMIIIYTQARKLKNSYRFLHAHDVFSAAAILTAAGKRNFTVLTTHFRISPWEEFAEAGYMKHKSISFEILRFFSTRVLRNKNLKKLAVSESNYQKVQLIDPDLTNPKTVIYPGLEIETRQSVLENKANYLVNVGTLNYRKNQILLIDILAELEKQGVETTLILVGPEEDGEKAKIKQRINELQIKSPVYFLGEKSAEQTRRLMANARLYIHTSLQESFGRTLIEAINLHTPVLALDYKAVHEIIADDAVISRNWEIVKTARFIKKFLTEKTAGEQLQKKQYQHFLKNFTEEKMVETYTKFLNQPWSLV